MDGSGSRAWGSAGEEAVPAAEVSAVSDEESMVAFTGEVAMGVDAWAITGFWCDREAGLLGVSSLRRTGRVTASTLRVGLGDLWRRDLKDVLYVSEGGFEDRGWFASSWEAAKAQENMNSQYISGRVRSGRLR